MSSHWTDNAGDRKTRTDWQNIVAFGNLRKYAAKLKKGDRVYVMAEVRNNNYERKIGTETVKLYETEFLAAAISALRSEPNQKPTSSPEELGWGSAGKTAPTMHDAYTQQERPDTQDWNNLGSGSFVLKSLAVKTSRPTCSGS